MSREQYEVQWKDYYQILQVPPNAEIQEINAAFRRLALIYHPDRNKSPDAAQRFVEINEAHEVLSDPQRRAGYDLTYWARENGTSGDPEPEPVHSSSWEGWQEEEHYSWDADTKVGPEPRWNAGRWWEWNPESEPTQPPPRDEPGLSPASGPWPWRLVCRLVEGLSPNPDESQRITPWLSWCWQRLWLMAAIPLGILVTFVALAQGAWPVALLALNFAGTAIYAGVSTRWLRATRDAPLQARLAGGTCITVSSISYTLVAAYVILAILVLVVIFIGMGLMLRAMLDSASGKQG